MTVSGVAWPGSMVRGGRVGTRVVHTGVGTRVGIPGGYTGGVPSQLLGERYMYSEAGPGGLQGRSGWYM